MSAELPDIKIGNILRRSALRVLWRDSITDPRIKREKPDSKWAIAAAIPKAKVVRCTQAGFFVETMDEERSIFHVSFQALEAKEWRST